ncbi:MAG TPA: tyrosine--tRNA ligase, partial [Chitinophagales bacterium]|nr:tyrosine--tRNA ligase [Chitinophagales bacterium]
ESGMSFTEFTYQLIQGYDFYHLWKNRGVKLQLGGSDQWGNIVTGTELIRRKDAGEAFALTTQLIKKADGTKFGKSEGGNIWLDAKKTSPFKFYQFLLRTKDSDAPTLMRIFSLRTREEIEALEMQHFADPGKRVLQKALAEEVTARVHSNEDLLIAQDKSGKLYGSFEDFKTLSETEMEDSFDESDSYKVSKDLFTAEVDVVGLLGEKTTIFSSKGEARKLIQGNGVSINKQKWSVDRKLTTADLLHGKYLLVQKGKTKYYLIAVN